MRSKILVLALSFLLFAADPSYAGTIARCAKLGGGTDFNDGQVISASEMNTDLNAIVNVINGNLDTDNLDTDSVDTDEIVAEAVTNAEVSSTAAIVYSKFAQDPHTQDMDIVDDYSTDEDEQDNTSNPGTAENVTLATNLEEEIAQLRYKIKELTVGTNATYVASGTDTDAGATWIDGPIRPGNLLYNGGFDVLTTLTSSADGNGWVRVNTPTTLAAEALVESEGMGDGNGINIIDTDAALSGIKQTLDGLKADRRYLALVATRDDVGTCRVVTSGADTNQMTVTSDDSGSWQILSGTFETDSNPTNVDFQLLAVAQNDDCVFENAGVYEINTDPISYRPVVVDFQQSTYDHAIGTTEDVIQVSAGVDLEASVTIPGPGYVLTAIARTACDPEAGAQDTVMVALERQIDAGGWNKVSVGSGDGDTANDNVSFSFIDVVINPTPGSEYQYRLVADTEANTCTFGNDNFLDTYDLTTEIMVKAEPSG